MAIATAHSSTATRLAAALGAGLNTELAVGSRSLRVTRILISRPDQSSTFVEFASALLINDADLAATKLIQPGSRIRYVLLLAGPSAQLDSFRRWHQTQEARHERVEDVADASPQIGDGEIAAQRIARADRAHVGQLIGIAVENRRQRHRQTRTREP